MVNLSIYFAATFLSAWADVDFKTRVDSPALSEFICNDSPNRLEEICAKISDICQKKFGSHNCTTSEINPTDRSTYVRYFIERFTAMRKNLKKLNICCGDNLECISKLENTNPLILTGSKDGPGQHGYYHYNKEYLGVYEDTLLKLNTKENIDAFLYHEFSHACAQSIKDTIAMSDEETIKYMSGELKRRLGDATFTCVVNALEERAKVNTKQKKKVNKAAWYEEVFADLVFAEGRTNIANFAVDCQYKEDAKHALPTSYFKCFLQSESVKNKYCHDKPAVQPAKQSPLRAVSSTDTFEDWKTKNSKLVIDDLEISYRVTGQGPFLTLIHGFPTSSMDWAKILPQLSEHFTVLVFDFIGFGDSSKPTDYAYSTFERAELVKKIWSHLKIDSTSIVAHDFGATVLLELLHQAEHKMLSTRIEKTVFLNGGLFTDLHRPTWAQKFLLSFAGPLFVKFITYNTFKKQVQSVVGIPLQESEIGEMWQSIQNRHGLKNYHKLIHYISDREKNRERWEPIVSNNNIPKKFIWGLKDPISGAHMLDEIKKRNPTATIAELEDVGHFPQLESPEPVLKEILSFLNSVN